MGANKKPNRLINERSPYLLQHAHNPVDWFPWGDEAFQKARAEDKPIFLSIGYSTCHWCHVMAQESFEDAQVADILNRDFVCIKVDREERPDVDAVYMAVCLAFNGSGGWPLTILMTPGQKPFWAGTYLPKTSQYGRLGLLELLSKAAMLWKTDKGQLTRTGENAVLQLQQFEKETPSTSELSKEVLASAFEWFGQAYDSAWGGFGMAPKFPTPYNLLFLLHYSSVEHEKSALSMVEHTLVQMYRGGIYDHIGGGFCRYSTDENWLVPHFEKTLYDNALLTQAYLAAYQITHRPLYRDIAENTLKYVLRELTDQKSGFYCGQDADSDGVEGKYYLFTPGEVQSVLGREDAQEFCKWYGITAAGNFEGKNIPNLIANSRYEERNPQIETDCKAIYAYRLKRTVLHKDDKVLTSWNALMIATLADAWLILQEPAYLKAAQSAQRFLSESLREQNGSLFRRWRNGEAGIAGQLDDYAFYAFALLKLYEATFQVSYLKEAVSCSKRMTELFFDEKGGGFFFYAKDSEPLISRPKVTDDSVMPSGNAVAFSVLFWLYQLTGEMTWQKLFQKQAVFLSGSLSSFPAGHCAALLALSEMLYPSRELVCVTAESQIPPQLQSFWRNQGKQFPFTVVKTKSNQQELAEAAPFTKDYPVPSEGTIYYLCKNGQCSKPVNNLQDLLHLLNGE